MSGPFKREIEPLFGQLLKLNKQSVKLIASQPYGPEEVYPAQEGDEQDERLTPQEYQITAETFLQRVRGVISRIRDVNKEWKAYIHNRTPLEATKASDDYFNFLMKDEDEDIHFTTLIEEGEQVITSVEQSLTVLRINQAQIPPAVQEKQNAAPQPLAEEPAAQPEPLKQNQAAFLNTQNAQQPVVENQQPVAENLLVQPHIQATAPPFDADFAVRPNDVNRHHDANTLQLPRMKPPIFGGDPLQWPTFWDLFEASVHNKPISNAEKMSYLVMSLRDVAEKAIQGYNITNDNYPIVVELLKRRFGNRQAIAEMLQSELIALPKATDAIQSLRTLSESVERICRQMSSMRLSDEHPIIATTIKAKLPYSVMTKLVERERAEGGSWNTAKLRQGIQEIIAVREEVQRSTGMTRNAPPTNSHKDTPRNSRYKNDGPHQEITRSFPVTSNDKKKFPQKRPKIQANIKPKTPGTKCYLCGKGLHWARDCKIVATADQRKKKLAELQRCFICLRTGHRTPECRSKWTCQKCNGRHNTLICSNGQNTYSGSKPSGIIVNTATEDGNTTNDSIVATSVSTQPSEVLLMAKETKISSTENPKRATQGLIFFDTGSQTSFIRIEVANQLRLKKLEESELEVHGFSQQPIRFQSPKYAVRIHLTDGHFIDLILNGTAKISSSFTTTKVAGVKHHPIMGKVANVLSKQRNEPDLLIGMGDFWQFLQRVEEMSKDLYMVYTTIGPMLCGRTHLPSVNNQRTISNVAIGPSNIEDMPHANDVKDFWSLEAIGVHDNPEDNDNEKAMELFRKSVHRINGRYCVRWPWKDDSPELPSNFEMCYSRLGAALHKLQSSPELLQEYDKVLKDQLEKGIIEPAKIKAGGLEHYLPHQPVIRLDKSSTKLRIVYDASAHRKDHAALNHCLYKGPTLLPDLAGLLMRFRTHKIVILTDVEKAFLNVALDKTDREVTKFLWLREPKQPLAPKNLIAYRFTRIAFGVISSPFLLAAVIQLHLSGYKSPVAAEIARNTYVDNILMSANSIKEAKAKITESKAIFAEAKMNLREYISNSPEVNESVPAEDRLGKANAKVLGIPWNPDSDELSISFIPKEVSAQRGYSKRTILQDLASTFDPLGLAAPAVLPGKIFFQTLWDNPNQDWDVPLIQQKITDWNQLSGFMANAKIAIPRQTPCNEESQLHVFVDASKDAYAAAIYIRTEDAETISANLVLSKNRLKPAQGMTIPRLELMAILIGVRLLKFAETQLHQNFQRQFLWSDSQCALRWISSTEDKTKFVANRLKEIRKYTNCSYRYVPTDENPSDLSTRGCSPAELQVHNQWWHGPPWLTCPEDQWPQILQVEPPTEAENEVITLIANPVMVTAATQLFDFKRFGKWQKLARTTAYALRFIRNSASNVSLKMDVNLPSNGSLAPEELEAATHALLRNHQRNLEITPEKASNWQLIEGPDGLLRVNSRLGNADLPTNAKKPIFLHPKEHFTQLIISELHAKNHHAGVDSTLTKFLANYWTLHARKQVRHVLNNCFTCRKTRAKPFSLPKMPDLPAERVSQSSPFQFSGLDYLGPTYIKDEGKLKKVWILLITCLATRAVYLDVVTDMGTVAFLNAFRRFVSRRNKPAEILSDNAAQFKTAQICLKENWDQLAKDDFANYFANQQIKWKFTPEFAPWHGSVYERLNALVKDAFKKTLGRKVLTLEEMQTFVTEVEATLNQRPLTYVSTDPDSPSPLRPIDFLVPKATIILQGPTPEDSEDWAPRLSTRDKVLNAWERTTAYLQRFWDLWKESYLTLLRERSQRDHKGPYLQNRRAPQLDEIVLIEEDLQPRNVWRLGRIVELPTSGPIRTAKVLTANKNILTRPINRLYSLEIPLSEESNSTQPETDPPENNSVEENQPPKAAESKHQFKLRDRARIKPPARTLLVTLALLCLTSITARPFKDCPSCDFSCTADGVRLQTPAFIKKVEICCKNFDCKEAHSLNDFSVELPQSLRANTHFCQAQVWGTRKYYQLEIECPAIDICQLTDCYLCVQQLRNPECRPNFSAILTGTGIMAILLAVCLVLKVIKTIASYLFECGKCVLCLGSLFCRCCAKTDKKMKTRLNTPSENEKLISSRKKPRTSYRPFRIRPFSLPGGKVIRVITILTFAICPPQTQQCADVISFSAKEEKCEVLRNETRCTINDATELTLLPAGQEVCLFLKDSKGSQMGTLKLKLDHISINCIPRTEAVTRSYAMKVEPRHHCPKVGSCSGDYCKNVNTETDIPELSEFYHYPGHSYCRDSCTLWDCTPGCGLPSSSCLFYRTYAYPLTDIIYEVFSCPDWRYGIKIELQLEVNQQVETTELTLVEGLVTHWKNISISPIIVAQPPAPVFGRRFITDGTNVAMVTSFSSDLNCANTSAAEEFKCTIKQEACTDCTNVGQDIHCKCKDLPIEDLIENPELRLPLMVGRYEVKNSAKDVFVESHHNPIRLFTKIESLRVVAATDGSTCTIRPINLTGCYRCDTGGELTYECSTDFGNALATVTCAKNLIFTQACNTNLSQYSTVLHFDSPNVNTNCTVECPGINTEFSLKGELRYIPISDQVGYEEISKKDNSPSKPSCILCDVEIPQLFDFIDTWSIIVYIMAAFVVSGLILACLIRLNPAFRLWKLSYRLIASGAVILVVLRFDQSAATWASFCQHSAAENTFGQSKGNALISQPANTSILINELSSYKNPEKEKKNHSYLGSNFYKLSIMESSSLIQVLLDKTETNGMMALRLHLRCLWADDRSRLVSWLRENHRLETTHLRLNRRIQIADITSLGAMHIKPFGRPRHSVADHFDEKHESLEHPSLQCVVENDGYEDGLPHRKYFPLEVIKATPINQRNPSAFRPIRGNTSIGQRATLQLGSPPPYSWQPPAVPTYPAPTEPNMLLVQTVRNRTELPSPPAYTPPVAMVPEADEHESDSSLNTDAQHILSTAVSTYIAGETIQFTHAQIDFSRLQNGAFKVNVTLTVGINRLQDQQTRENVLEEARAQLASTALNLYTPESQALIKRSTMRCRDRARKVRSLVQGALITMEAKMGISYEITGAEFKFSISEYRVLPTTQCTDTHCNDHGQNIPRNSTNNTRRVPMPRLTNTRRVPMPRLSQHPRRLTGNMGSRFMFLSIIAALLPIVSAQSYGPTKEYGLISLITIFTMAMSTASINPTLSEIRKFYSRPAPLCKNCNEPGHFALDCDEVRHLRLSGHGNNIWAKRCIPTSKLDRPLTCKRKRNVKTNQMTKKSTRSAATMSQLKFAIPPIMTHLNKIGMFKGNGIYKNSPFKLTGRRLQQHMSEVSNAEIMTACNSLADDYAQEIVTEAKRPPPNKGTKARSNPKQGPAGQSALVKKGPVKRVTIRPRPQAPPEAQPAPTQQIAQPQTAPPAQVQQVATRQNTAPQEAPVRKATNPRHPVAPRKTAPQPPKRPRSPTPELDYEPEDIPEEDEQEEYYEEGELEEPEEIPESPPRRKILKSVVQRKQDSPQKKSPTPPRRRKQDSPQEESPTPPRHHQRGRSKRESSTPPRRHRARSKSRTPPRRRARSKSESPQRQRARSMAPDPHNSKKDSRPRKDAPRHSERESREDGPSSSRHVQQPADGTWVSGRDGRTLCRFAETILEIFGKKP